MQSILHVAKRGFKTFDMRFQLVMFGAQNVVLLHKQAIQIGVSAKLRVQALVLLAQK